jgi:VanZ family protein
MIIKVLFSVAAIILLIFLALGPKNWQPRTGLGWRINHFVGYFAFTLWFCFTWRRPLVVGGALIVAAVLLESLQAFTHDRSSNFLGALYGGGGVLVAVLLAELFMRRFLY